MSSTWPSSSAEAAGALGARMTGGGFGGSAIALVPSGELDAVGAAVLQAFARESLAEPALLPVAPSPGAARDL